LPKHLVKGFEVTHSAPVSTLEPIKCKCETVFKICFHMWYTCTALRHGGFEGDVRVRQPEAAAAAGLNPDTFLYVEESHPAVNDGKFAPASRTVRMPLREAAARMVKNTSGEGGVYVQAELSEALAREAGLTLTTTTTGGDDDEEDEDEGEDVAAAATASSDEGGVGGSGGELSTSRASLSSSEATTSAAARGAAASRSGGAGGPQAPRGSAEAAGAAAAAAAAAAVAALSLTSSSSSSSSSTSPSSSASAAAASTSATAEAPPFETMEPWRTMAAAGWKQTQSPRMWLSAAGAVSPLHYDHSVSVLAQVHGTKRMLLYPPSTLSRAHLYPNWHPLRRRSRVQLDSRLSEEEAAAAWPRWTPSSEEDSAVGGGGGKPPGAWEAVLGPGDVLVFPPRWVGLYKLN
jgi:hypothetical protein